MRPVTIKQLNEAESIGETDFKVDGTQISQVTLVAQVRNASRQTTHITYKLDDGTGHIEAKQWLDQESAEDDGPKVPEDSYVRVWGKLKSFGNRRHVGTHFIRPITDFNEVSFHLLEATAVHMYFTKGPPGGGDKSDGVNGGAQQQGTMTTLGGGVVPAGLSTIAQKVYQCLQMTPQNNEGLHCEDIASKTRMSHADVTRGGGELLDRGLIYTTVDDFTWSILHGM